MQNDEHPATRRDLNALREEFASALRSVKSEGEQVRHWAFGNGSRGAAEELRDLKQAQDRQQAILARIEKQSTSNSEVITAMRNQVQGAVTWSKWVVGAVPIIIGFFVWILDRLGERQMQQILEAIKTLPQ